MCLSNRPSNNRLYANRLLLLSALLREALASVSCDCGAVQLVTVLRVDHHLIPFLNGHLCCPIPQLRECGRARAGMNVRAAGWEGSGVGAHTQSWQGCGTLKLTAAVTTALHLLGIQIVRTLSRMGHWLTGPYHEDLDTGNRWWGTERHFLQWCSHCVHMELIGSPRTSSFLVGSEREARVRREDQIWSKHIMYVWRVCAQGLRAHNALPEDPSQLPVTQSPGDPMFSSGYCGPCAHVHTTSKLKWKTLI